jgi:hypothetical protein
MGGSGSGRRWYQGAADCTDEYRCIDVRHWQREHMLRPDHSFGWYWSRDGVRVASINVTVADEHVRLNYRHRLQGGTWQPLEYQVLISTTYCTFGSYRPWFHCPSPACGRRVALLYLGRNGTFACRYCLHLAYRSCREMPHERLARRGEGIRRRLEWAPGILSTPEGRPKGMHQQTYQRLIANHDKLVAMTMEAATIYFKGWNPIS